MVVHEHQAEAADEAVSSAVGTGSKRRWYSLAKSCPVLLWSQLFQGSCNYWGISCISPSNPYMLELSYHLLALRGAWRQSCLLQL